MIDRSALTTALAEQRAKEEAEEKQEERYAELAKLADERSEAIRLCAAALRHLGAQDIALEAEKLAPPVDPKKKARAAMGERIRLARGATSRFDIAIHMDITPVAIVRWEYGLSAPNDETIAKLSELLVVSQEWLKTGRYSAEAMGY